MTSPSLLDTFQPHDGFADTQLIRTFVEHTFDPFNARAIRHQLTRISRRVYIIFDCIDLAHDDRPPVAAFNVCFKNAMLSVARLERVGLEKWVNDTVETWQRRRPVHDKTLPSRTDLRRHKVEREHARIT